MQLDVYFHDEKVGELHQEEATGRLGFQYRLPYVLKRGAPLSLTLPVRDHFYGDDVATPFFSSLLPEETMRENLAKNLGTSEENVFAMLQEVGRECAGAVAFYPPGQKPRLAEQKTRLTLIQDDQLAKILGVLRQKPLLRGMSLGDKDEDGVRLSLAGAQAKLAVGLMADQIVLVTDGAPTTHIIKPALPDYDHIVENEFFCMRLAFAVGIPTADVALRHAKEKAYLLVKRYDREITPGGVFRLHQEDFCQAMGIPPQKKYEKNGGPSLTSCLELIKKHSHQPIRDQQRFLHLAMFNYFIGNADAHGKNFSFLYRDRAISLAPAYDLICTAAYPQLAHSMAMKIGGHYDPDIITRRHWSDLMPQTKTSQRQLDQWLTYFAKILPDAALKLKRDLEEQEISSPAFDTILSVINTRTTQFLASF